MIFKFNDYKLEYSKLYIIINESGIVFNQFSLIRTTCGKKSELKYKELKNIVISFKK